MNYYSDLEEEPNAGSSESKWEPTADMNIIKSVMNAATTIIPSREDFGRVLSANFSKLGDGQTMNARMEISTHLWTIVWENTDSPDSKISNFSLKPTQEQKEIEKSLQFATTSAELEKLFTLDGSV